MEVVGGLRAHSPTVDVHHQLHHRLILHMPPMRKLAQCCGACLASAQREGRRKSTVLNESQIDEKGSTRVRASGELIYDKLVGQKDSNMICLLSEAHRARPEPSWQVTGESPSSLLGDSAARM